jgi:hypothetical protein
MEIQRSNAASEGGKAIRVLGHWLYCRRCVRADSVGGIVVPDKSRDWSNDDHDWLEVIAIGDKVGKPLDWPKALLEHRKQPRTLSADFKIGDLVMVDRHLEDWQIQHSPYCEYEFFIHERVPKLLHREE